MADIEVPLTLRNPLDEIRAGMVGSYEFRPMLRRRQFDFLSPLASIALIVNERT